MAAYDKVLPRARPGDVITAKMWNAIVDHVNRQRLMFGQDCGLNVLESPNGTAVRFSRTIPDLKVAKTSSSITARSSTTAGTGTVTPQTFDGTALAADGGGDVTVYNFSAAAIDTGKYCAICDCGDGYPFVVSVEC